MPLFLTSIVTFITFTLTTWWSKLSNLFPDSPHTNPPPTFHNLPRAMSDLMNQSTHPCNDFYEYTCGNWIHQQKFEPSVSRLSYAYDLLDVYRQKTMLKIVKENPPILGPFWKSCMAIDEINKLNGQPIESDLRRIQKVQTREELFELMGKFSRTNTNMILKYHVRRDISNRKLRILYFSQALVTLPIQYYKTDKFPTIEKCFRNYITTLFKLGGVSFQSSDRADDIVIRIEKEIVNIKKEFTYGEGGDLSIEYGSLLWPYTFGAYTRGIGINLSPKHTGVRIESFTYMDKVESNMKKINVEDLKVYAAYTLLKCRVTWLGDDFNNAAQNNFAMISGQGERTKSREEYCTKRMLQYLPELVGHYFYKVSFDSERKKQIKFMTKLINETMAEHITQSKWLDPSTQKEAKKKLAKVKYLIGKPKKLEHYPYSLFPDDYYNNIYTILKHSFRIKMQRMNRPVDLEDWNDISPSGTNPYYSYLDNKIHLPIANLQPPFFSDESVHPARNFGAIGYVIGHELTHGFDSMGRKYNGDGEPHNWWSPAASRRFNSNARYFINQYSKFQVNGEKGMLGTVNGDVTLNENIADNGGVALAWEAYRKYMERHYKRPDDDQVDSEGDKMFFIAYGQIYCSKTRDERMKMLLDRGTHAADRYRVNGVVMNNEDFARVFKCKVKSPMNRLEKCKIW